MHRPSPSRRPPVATSPPSSARLLRAWSVLSTCAAVGIAAWHFGARTPDPVAAPAACPPPVVFAACVGPTAPAPSEVEVATDDEPVTDEEQPGEPLRIPLDALVVGDEEDAPIAAGDHPTRYGEDDWDDDDVVVWRPSSWRAGTVSRRSSTGTGTGASALPPGCLASPLCVLASLGAGGPVPDSVTGLGYVFGRARDDFHRGDFAGAARGFLAAVARLPEIAPTIDDESAASDDDAGPRAIAADRRWLCRSAALSIAAANGTSDDALFTRLCAPRQTASLPSLETPATPTHG